MANRNFTPVNFALEKNVIHLFANVTFGATGVPTLDTNNSKGVCAVHPESISFTGFVTNSTTGIGTVSSFAGLYTGMTVTGTGVATSNVISSTSVATGLTMTKQNITTTASGYSQALIASGGRYRFQFGSREGYNLDAYNKLLAVTAHYSETSGSALGTALNVALAPNSPSIFVVEDKTNTRTTTRSATCASTDCSLVLQMGDGAGVQFNARDPIAGEAIKFHFIFGNSTAI